MNQPAFNLSDPETGAPLQFTAVGNNGVPHSLADGILQAGGGQAWPQIDGIPFLRIGRKALAEQVVKLLRHGYRPQALGLLLTDVDDFAAAAPDHATATRVACAVESGQSSAIESMRELSYGPVADYFAIRPSTPTFISGLELLARYVDGSQPVLEIACGIGHFLSHLSRHGVRCAGCDVTFSKLWLARHFLLSSDVPLLCADISGKHFFEPVSREGHTVFCHDAFYFLPDKPAVARRFEAIAGPGGQILLGHVHLAGYDHAGIAGDLCGPTDYAALFRSVVHTYDDVALIRAWASCTSATPVAADALVGREAMALVAGKAGTPTTQQDLRLDPPDELLYANPLLNADADQCLQPNWPTEAFAREYAYAPYLGNGRALEPGALPRQAKAVATPLQIRRYGLPAAFVEVAVKPLRWAVIGCGWVARDHVLPAFAHAPNARLVALCDTDPVKLASCLGGGANGPTRYTDHRIMLQQETLDAVYIATPNHRHAAICIDAAAAGCDVLCEKPMAATREDACAMVEVCRTAGITYATAFDQRFHEAHQVLREAIGDGRLGTISQARVHYSCQVDAQWRASEDDIDNWRLDRRRAGGGAVIDLAPHALDLLAFILNDEPCALDMRLQPRLTLAAGNVEGSVGGSVGDGNVRATADGWRNSEAPLAVDAGGVLSVEFTRGSLASIHVSYQTPEFLPRRDIELIGSIGGARGLDTLGQSPGGQIEWREADGRRTEVFSDADGLSPFARQIVAFSAARLAKQPWPFSPARELRHFQLLLDAMGRAEASLTSTRGPDRSSAGILSDVPDKSSSASHLTITEPA